jgi:hypothetical protein
MNSGKPMRRGDPAINLGKSNDDDRVADSSDLCGTIFGVGIAHDLPIGLRVLVGVVAGESGGLSDRA